MSDSSHEDLTPSSLDQPPCEVPQRLDYWTLLGHPHDQALPQLTEPFWQQAPEVAYPQSYYYPEQDLYTLFPIYHIYPSFMDPTPVVIGFKSRYARSNTESPNTKMKRPRQTVKVYLGDEYVGEIALGVIVRFSKLAKATFPKPQAATDKEADSNKNAKSTHDANIRIDSGVEQGEKKSWAEMTDDAQSDPSNQAPTDTQNPAATSATSPAQNITPTEPLEPKGLDISVAGAWIQPEVSVAKHILNWMQQNKRTRNNEPLLPITPLPLSSISLKALIDTYTGVLAYDLAPFPHDLRHEILTRLTKEPTQASQIQYLYEHLPLEDPILNRMVTSYFEHLDAGHYSQFEIDAIHKYVQENTGDEGELDRHFSRVQRSRNRKQSRETALKTLREGFENFAGPLLDALPVADDDKKNKGNKGAVRDDEGEGRRRNRRQQQANGGAKAKGKVNASTASKGKAS